MTTNEMSNLDTQGDASPKPQKRTRLIRKASLDALSRYKRARPMKAISDTESEQEEGSSSPSGKEQEASCRSQRTHKRDKVLSVLPKTVDAELAGLRDRTGRTQLHKFASAGDVYSVQALLTASALVNITDNAGWTPLHEAALAGHLEIVRLLINREARVNSRGLHGDTPLHDAAENGHVDVVKILLENGACPTVLNDENVSPVDVADESVKPIIKSWLEKHKAAFAVDAASRSTNLHKAASEGRSKDVFRYTLMGANMDAKDDLGRTALHYAALSGHADIVSHLVDRGASLNVQDAQQNTPLHLACENNREEVPTVLIQAGAKPEMENSKGRTAKELATSGIIRDALTRQEGGSVSPIPGKMTGRGIVDSGTRVLPGLSREDRKLQQLWRTFQRLENGDDRRRGLYYYFVHTDEPFYYVKSAPRKKRRSSVSRSARKDDASMADNSDDIMSVKSRRMKKSDALNQRNDGDSETLDVEYRDRVGRTWLHKYAAKGNLAKVDSLLKMDIDVNAADNAGWTALHEAALKGHVEIVRALLNHGAQVDVPGMNDDTPLHDAVENGHVDVVQVLLEFNADPTKKNASGSAALDVCDDDEVMAILTEAITKKSRSTRRLKTSQGDLRAPAILSAKDDLPTPAKRKRGRPPKDAADVVPPLKIELKTEPEDIAPQKSDLIAFESQTAQGEVAAVADSRISPKSRVPSKKKASVAVAVAVKAKLPGKLELLDKTDGSSISNLDSSPRSPIRTRPAVGLTGYRSFTADKEATKSAVVVPKAAPNGMLSTESDSSFTSDTNHGGTVAPSSEAVYSASPSPRVAPEFVLYLFVLRALEEREGEDTYVLDWQIPVLLNMDRTSSGVVSLEAPDFLRKHPSIRHRTATEAERQLLERSEVISRLQIGLPSPRSFNFVLECDLMAVLCRDYSTLLSRIRTERVFLTDSAKQPTRIVLPPKHAYKLGLQFGQGWTPSS